MSRPTRIDWDIAHYVRLTFIGDTTAGPGFILSTKASGDDEWIDTPMLNATQIEELAEKVKQVRQLGGLDG